MEGSGYLDVCGEYIITESHPRLRMLQIPVVKVTPKGVWLEWSTQWSDLKFQCHNWTKKFACATIDEAVASYRARKARQIGIYEARLRTARRCLELLDKEKDRSKWAIL